MDSILRRICAISALSLAALPALAADWAMWGNTPSRNMVSTETGLPESFDPGRLKDGTEDVDMATTKNVRWVAKLGSQSYGNPVVAGGKVYVGTNNEVPRDKRYVGDRSNLMCFDEKTGNFLWQLSVPKLGTGKVSDWEFLGICSSAAVEGDRAYIITTRNEVVCLDTAGMANGNQGPYMDEGKYLAGPGKPAVTAGPTDADILWRFDMREELGVFPHNTSSGSIVLMGDRLALATSNGVDWTHTNVPNPKAPALVMLDKRTGELLGEEALGISGRTLHANWSSPCYGRVGDRELLIFGGGDGWVYAFDARQTVKGEDGTALLKEVWRYDANPPEYRSKNGKPVKYATPEGPSEVIATPVFWNNRVYVPIGQDPEHGEGLGNFVCIDATKTGDITKTGTVWTNKSVPRSLSTPSILDGLVYCGDFSGYIRCLDAETGKEYWKHDTKSHIWGSTLAGDGKVYAGTEDGDLVVLKTGKEEKVVTKVDMRSPLYSSPVVANGILYVATPTHLYAVRK